METQTNNPGFGQSHSVGAVYTPSNPSAPAQPTQPNHTAAQLGYEEIHPTPAESPTSSSTSYPEPTTRTQSFYAQPLNIKPSSQPPTGGTTNPASPSNGDSSPFKTLLIILAILLLGGSIGAM